MLQSFDTHIRRCLAVAGYTLVKLHILRDNSQDFWSFKVVFNAPGEGQTETLCIVPDAELEAFEEDPLAFTLPEKKVERPQLRLIKGGKLC